MRTEFENPSSSQHLYTRRKFLKILAGAAIATTGIATAQRVAAQETAAPIELQQFFPSQLGININTANIRWLGLDVGKTVDLLMDLPCDSARIPVPFDEVVKEPRKDEHGNDIYEFDFSSVDWIIEKAIEKGKKIDLQLGIKTINYPEAHVPPWLAKRFPYLMRDGAQLDKDPYVREIILRYIKAVGERYFPLKAIQTLQIENEPFSRRIHVSRGRYISTAFNEEEVRLAKSLDPYHRPFVQNVPWDDTPEMIGYVLGTADIVGFNVYNQHNDGSLVGRALNKARLSALQVGIQAARLANPNLKVRFTEVEVAAWLNAAKQPAYPYSVSKVKELLIMLANLAPEAGIYLWDLEQILSQGTSEQKALLRAVLTPPKAGTIVQFPSRQELAQVA